MIDLSNSIYAWFPNVSVELSAHSPTEVFWGRPSLTFLKPLSCSVATTLPSLLQLPPTSSANPPLPLSRLICMCSCILIIRIPVEYILRSLLFILNVKLELLEHFAKLFELLGLADLQVVHTPTRNVHLPTTWLTVAEDFLRSFNFMRLAEYAE